MTATRYWLGVVSRAHVLIGVEGGFIQLNHGKEAPLIEYLDFIKDKRRWGYAFRFGHLEIPEVDFRLIACEMGILL